MKKRILKSVGFLGAELLVLWALVCLLAALKLLGRSWPVADLVINSLAYAIPIFLVGLLAYLVVSAFRGPHARLISALVSGLVLAVSVRGAMVRAHAPKPQPTSEPVPALQTPGPK